MSETALLCGQCGAQVLVGELFCENCGAVLAQAGPAAAPGPAELPGLTELPEPSDLPAALGSPGSLAVKLKALSGPPTMTPELPCASCGGTAFEDGYCSTCGAPSLSSRDHWREQPASWVAAVCDRGLRHHRNEDAMALAALPEPASRAVLVVCDGVSSSVDSDLASLAAARAARDVLAGPTLQPESPGAGEATGGPVRFWGERLVAASEAANAMAAAAAAAPSGRPSAYAGSPPSCTFVAAVVDGPLVVAGWVGDSRAYWVPDHGPAAQLSIDDSWASEQIRSGMPREQAESSPRAHAITRWLGTDSPDHRARCSAFSPAGPGWLVVCSDGLWNYCSAASDLGALVARTAAAAGAAAEPVLLAAELVAWANEQGGQDNITVALARWQRTAP